MKENIPDNYIDLTITSPPYDKLRNYNGYNFDFENIAQELYRVTKNEGVVIWVVGDETKNFCESLTSFNQAIYFKNIGFKIETMIYEKQNPTYNINSKRYKQSFEFMFILNKGNPKTFNPIRDVEIKNIKPRMVKKRRNNTEDCVELYIPKNTHTVRDNIWKYNPGSSSSKDKIAFLHPAIFPEQLAQDHILSWSNEGDIIFDPMCGSGTTCKMAWLNKRNFIGIDISEEYINNICIPRLNTYDWEQNQKITFQKCL